MRVAPSVDAPRLRRNDNSIDAVLYRQNQFGRCKIAGYRTQEGRCFAAAAWRERYGATSSRILGLGFLIHDRLGNPRQRLVGRLLLA